VKYRRRFSIVNRFEGICYRSFPQVVDAQPVAFPIFSAKVGFMAQIDDKQIAKLRSLIVALQDFVDSLETGADLLTNELRQRISEYREANRCLYCGQKLEGKVTRGCHQACYSLIKQRIGRGKLTQEEAIRRGWMNPVADSPGRRSKRPDPMRDTPEEERNPVAEDIEAIHAITAAKRGRKRK
jgi:sRNA-binding protein